MKFTKYIGLLAMPLLIACNGNTPSSSKDEFTVTWKNYDGTVLEIDKNVKKGTTPTYDSFTPIKESTSEHAYTFLGWTPAVTPVTSDTEYYAQFTPHKICKITWENYDKSVLKVDNIVEGTTPIYHGPTPTKPSTENGDFIFCNWSPNVEKVTSDATYIAQYTYRIKNGCNYELNDDENSYKVVGFTGAVSGSNLKILDKVFDKPVTKIDDNAFAECDSLTSITIPNSVTSIGSNAFLNCHNLRSINIPKSVVSINATSFSGCSSLESITVDSDNATYDSRNDCNAIINKSNNSLILGCKNTEIPDDITSIGDYAFYDCSSLETITFPTGLTSIGNNAFNGCSSLTSITFPENLSSIGDDAFDYCSKLTSIVIPKNLTSIATQKRANPFIGCSSLETITVDSNNTTFSSKDSDGKECNAIIGSNYGDISILVGCKNTTIPSRSLLFPDRDINRIASHAFSGCKSLESISFPNTIRTILTESFADCASLTSITIPKNIEIINSDAFIGCNSLNTITVENGNNVFDSRSNCNAIIVTAKNELVTGCKSTSIPNNVTSIGHCAFSGCTSLTSITIPNGVTSIGSYAFYGCTSLTSVSLPDSVSNISNAAFEQCTSLKSINIPAKVTTIGTSTFYNCTSLTLITIPENVTKIGLSAFLNCSSLKSIVIPKKVSKIYGYAFSGCSSLESITVDSQNTTFDSRENCNSIIYKKTNILLAGCKNTIIPNSVSLIDDLAFYNCSSLESITIPNSVNSIGELAFYGCTSLNSIDLSSTDHVVDVKVSSFRNCKSLSVGSIKVQPDLLNDYIYSTGWSCYAEYFAGTY